MPFGDPRWYYNERSIEELKAGQMGCYGIFNAQNRIIYIGKAEDLRERTLSHVRNENPEDARINRYSPALWAGLVVQSAVRMDSLEKELIREYDPPANLKVG